MGQRVFRILESRQPEGPSPRHLLPVVSKITHLAPHTLHEGIRPPGEARVGGAEGGGPGRPGAQHPVGTSCLFSRKTYECPCSPHLGIYVFPTCYPRSPPAPHRPIDQTNQLSKRLVDWLRYASVQQGVAHTSGGFFSTPRARQVSLGTPTVPVPGRPRATLAGLARGVPSAPPIFPPALVPE